ncbi:MAG: IS630 family transposase [Bacteroidota bacterium]
MILKKTPRKAGIRLSKFPRILTFTAVVVFFEDEARFGRISREMACWVKGNMVPSVARQMVREYIYAYSALSPQTGDCYSMISPYCNTEAMNEFLQQLSSHYNNYRIIIILDKAGWHISQSLEIGHNIRLLHLNPYSPELNPVELLWREIRRKYFHNIIFENLDEVENTLHKALANYHQQNNDVKKLSKGFL